MRLERPAKALRAAAFRLCRRVATAVPGGRIVGKTSGAPKSDTNDHSTNLNESNSVENLHATIFRAFGIDSAEELMTPVGRPMKISEGKPIKKLLEG